MYEIAHLNYDFCDFISAIVEFFVSISHISVILNRQTYFCTTIA